MHRSLREKVLSTLHEASSALKFLQDDCFIIGAAALVLAGVKLEHTPDIDLLTSSRDAKSLLNFWKDKTIAYQPGSPELFRSTYGRFRFEAIDVEVMGDLEVNQSGIWNKLQVQDCFTIETGDGRWKVASLPEQLRILKIFGREKDFKRIEMIQQHWKANA